MPTRSGGSYHVRQGKEVRNGEAFREPSTQEIAEAKRQEDAERYAKPQAASQGVATKSKGSEE